jgi:AraC-like DNA-binding protein
MINRSPTPTTFGSERRRLDLHGVTLIESTYTPAMKIGTHAHDRPVVVLVLEGTVTTTGTSTFTHGPNAVRTVPAGEKHSNSYGSKGARCFLVEIRPELREHLGRHVELLEQPLPSGAVGAADVFRRMYEEFALDDDVAPLAIQGCLLELVARLARVAMRSAAPPWLSRVRDILSDRSRGAMSIRELSVAVDVHPVHLARQFRLYYGCSPSTFVRLLRVDWARRALRQTDQALSSIALEAGFADQSHLTREFRRLTGMTPARYRARARNEFQPFQQRFARSRLGRWER